MQAIEIEALHFPYPSRKTPTLTGINAGVSPGEFILLTGQTGCGKSTLLEYFRQNTNKNHVILAPTGVTAIKAKGSTIHKFFKFPPRFVTKEDVKVFRDRNFFSRLETLLIDESSMIRSDIFDLIDLSLKKNRRNKKPFGGVQIILFGDLLQLSPVVSCESVIPESAT